MPVRTAKEQDIPLLCALYTQFYRYNAEQQSTFYLAASESGEYPKGVIADAHGEIFIAEESGEALGFLHVQQETTPPYASVAPHSFASIVDFYVLPQHREKGTGSALLAAAKSWARERGLEYMELHVLKENALGQAFYERKDFTPSSHVMRHWL